MSRQKRKLYKQTVVRNWGEMNPQYQGEVGWFSGKVFVELTGHVSLRISPVYNFPSGRLVARIEEVFYEVFEGQSWGIKSVDWFLSV